MTTSALLPVAALPPAPVPMKPHTVGVPPIPGYMSHYSYLRRHHTFTPRRASVHASTFPAGTFSPVEVAKTYNWPKLTVTQKIKIGVLSLGGIGSQSDLDAFCRANNLPTTKITFLAASGADTTSDPGGANVEGNLDLQCVWASLCVAMGDSVSQVELVFGSAQNSEAGPPAGVTMLADYGCVVITYSWGSPDAAGAGRTAMEAASAAAIAKNCTLICASGDNSLDDGTNSPTCDYAAGSAYWWAVGGTALTITATGFHESAWGTGTASGEGSGGGYDPLTPQPSWQVGVVPEPHNGVVCIGKPDSAANAAPETGYQMISDGVWQIVGGTSASAPLTAGFVAAIKATGAVFGLMGPILYAARGTAFDDVTTGSNGEPAEAGFDISTGNGSPWGPGFAAALMGKPSPSLPPFPPPTGTTTPPVTPPTGTAPPPVVQPPPVVIPPPVTPPAGAGIGVVQFRQLMRWVQVMLLESQGQLETTVRSVIAGLPLSPQQLATVNTVIASVLASIGARRGLGSPGALPKATYAAVSADDFSPLVEFFAVERLAPRSDVPGG